MFTGLPIGYTYLLRILLEFLPLSYNYSTDCFIVFVPVVVAATSIVMDTPLPKIT